MNISSHHLKVCRATLPGFIIMVLVVVMLFVPALASVKQRANKNSIRRHGEAVLQANNPSDFTLFLEHHLQRLPDAQKKTFVQHLAASNYYVDSADFWSLLAPDQVVSAVDFFDEPFSPALLNRLEKALPLLNSPHQKLRTSAILYRYGRAVGYAYLADQVRDYGSVDAACIFALRQDATMQDDVVDMLSYDDTTTSTHKFDVNSPHFGQLLQLLGLWHDEKIGKALWKLYMHIPRYPLLAIVTANQGVSDSLELSTEQYFRSDEFGQKKWQYGCAVVKLVGSIKAEQISNRLIEQLDSATVPTDQKLTLIRTFSYLRLQDANPTLRTMIAKTSYQLNKFAPLEDPELDIAVSASEALVITDSFNSLNRDVIFNLLLNLDKSTAYPLYVERVAQALIKINGTEDMVERVMGKEWYQRELTIQKLSPLPNFLLLSNGTTKTNTF